MTGSPKQFCFYLEQPLRALNLAPAAAGREYLTPFTFGIFQNNSFFPLQNLLRGLDWDNDTRRD